MALVVLPVLPLDGASAAAAYLVEDLGDPLLDSPGSSQGRGHHSCGPGSLHRGTVTGLGFIITIVIITVVFLTAIVIQACISNTPKASVTMLQSDECWVSLWWIMAFPHIYDVSHSKFHELGQN